MSSRDRFFKIREFISRGRRAQIAVDEILQEKPCKVKCAAIRTKDETIVFTGRSHAAIITEQPKGVCNTGTQGFITTNGRFVDRYEAAEIALKAGQTKKLESPLFSEDLTGDWPWKQEQLCKTCGGKGYKLPKGIVVGWVFSQAKKNYIKEFPCPDCKPEEKGATDGGKTQLSHQS